MSITRRAFVAGAVGAALADKSARGAGSRWIDVHLHTIGGVKRQFGEAVQQAVAEMDARGLQKAVLFPPPYPNRAAAYDYTDYVPHLKRFPDRFGFLAGGGTLNPTLQEHKNPASVTPAVQSEFTDLARKMLDDGAVGFGEIAVLHFSLVPHHAFEEVPVEHPLLYALVEVAGSRQAVIDLHMDPVIVDAMRTPPSLKIPPNPPTLKANIAGFEKLLAHDRNARIVWAHGGSDFSGNMTPALIGRLMDSHSNLYMSLRPLPVAAASNNPFGLKIQNLMIGPKGVEPSWLGLLKRHADRFVMGADAFILSPSVRSDGPLASLAQGNEGRFRAAERLLSLLPAAVARKIATENAVRLYRL